MMWPFKKKPVDTRPVFHVSFLGKLNCYEYQFDRLHHTYRANSEAEVVNIMSLWLFQKGNVIKSQGDREMTVTQVDVRPEHSNGDQSEYKVVGLGLLKRV